VYYLVVNTSAIDCLERLISEVTCYLSSGMVNSLFTVVVMKVLCQTVNICRFLCVGRIQLVNLLSSFVLHYLYMSLGF